MSEAAKPCRISYGMCQEHQSRVTWEETHDYCEESAIKGHARRPASSQALEVAVDDFRYIAEQCESVARTEGVSVQEARTWRVVGRLAREAGKKLGAALAARGEVGQ